MKKIIAFISFILILILTVVPAFAVEPSIEKLNDDPDKNEIMAMTAEIVDAVNEAIDYENRNKKFTDYAYSLPYITADDIDFSNMYKLYTYADDILTAESEEEVKEVLKNSPYSWVLVVYVDNLAFEVKFRKWSELSREALFSLTNLEKEKIYMEKGEYRILNTVLITDAGFFEKAVRNGKFTYFANIPTIASDTAIQIRNDKCFILCRKGDASGTYVKTNRIEPLPITHTVLFHDDPSYVLTGHDFPWTAVIISALILIVIFLTVIIKKTYNRIKTET